MKEKLLRYLDDPTELEKLYRSDKSNFRQAFDKLYPEIEEKPIAQFWNQRLNYHREGISWGSKNELLFVIIASVLAALIARIPLLTGVDEDYFFPRNIGFIVFPFLTAYFAWKKNIRPRKMYVLGIAFVLSALYINFLPGDDNSDTFILACIHLLLVLWGLLAVSYMGEKHNNYKYRLEFLRYNGDLVVMTTLLLISGGLLTAITLGLFELIELNITEFYFEYIALTGLAASPMVGTYLVRTNPALVGKVSPVIAKVFSPLVFLMLVVYLIAVITTGKDPYTDREFLIIFNALLIGVMALILFSVAETSGNTKNKLGTLILLGLSLVTVIVNGIALSAIVFRISEWGITPNRLAVLGGNILILTNLLIVTYKQFIVIRNSDRTEEVENGIAFFLPIYFGWAILVTFVFPFIFDFQ